MSLNTTMIIIKIYKELSKKCTATLNICDKINIIVDDSGTGKSYLCNMLKHENKEYSYIHEAYTNEGKEVQLFYCEDLDDFTSKLYDKSKDNCIIIIDEYLATMLNKIENIKIREYISKCNKYFIIFQRDSIIKYCVNTNSIFKIAYEHEQYTFKKVIGPNELYSHLYIK